MSQAAPAAGIDRSQPPAPGALRPFHFPPIARATLSNGIPLLYAPGGGFEVATLAVMIRAGGVHEDERRGGLASLTSSLLESGAGERSAAEIAEEVERLGVQLGVGAGWDSVQVEITGLTSRFPAALSLVSDLLRRPTFPEPEVERIRQEQLAAIVQRRADPRGLANEMASRYLFSERSPFSRPLSGSSETLRGLTRSDAVEYHGKHFSASESMVVVAGDLPLETAVQLAEEAFGALGGTAVPEPAPVAEPRFATTEIVVVDRPDAVQSEIRIGRVGMSRSTPDYFPIVVMNAILGGTFSSRLNLNLRERHGYTYGVSSAFVMRRNPGPFLVSTAVQTEVTAPAVREIVREMEAIRAEPVAERELQDARNFLAGIFPLRLQTTEGVASRLAELALYDLAEDYFERYRDRILEVTADQVHDAAVRYVLPEASTVIVVGDAARIRRPLEELGLGPVRLTDPEVAEG